MTNRTVSLLLLLGLTIAFSLATWLQPRSLGWRGKRAQADTMLKVLLGDGRRMFANHFYTKADVYLHSGYYPSIFDQAKLSCEDHLTGATEEHDAEAREGEAHQGHDHEAEHDFLGKPKDWIDRFSRRFRLTQDTHLESTTGREILPWLKLSAELDPQRVETYTVAAYWLRAKLHKTHEAEAFLRDGLRANPDSHEILYELGLLLYDNRKDAARARNVWEMALRKWQKNEGSKSEPDRQALHGILINLARLEEAEGNLAKAVAYLKQVKPLSPDPALIQEQINTLQQRLHQPSTQRPP